MRLQQVKNLTDEELGMLLFMINNIDPVKNIDFEITPNWLPSIRHDLLLQKVFRAQSHIKPESAPILQSLWNKLHAKWDYEVIENNANDNPTNTEPSGSNIQSESDRVHLETTASGCSDTTNSTGSEQQGSGSAPPEQPSPG